MILANRNGWLIGGQVERETAKAYYFLPWDSDKPIRVPFDDEKRKVFKDAFAAEKWIKRVGEQS